MKETYFRIFDCKALRALVGHRPDHLNQTAMEASSPTAKSIFSRRRILGWSGAGAIGGLAGYFGWPNHESQVASETKPISQAPAAASTITPAAIKDGLHREKFLPHLRTAFTLDNSHRCILLEVSPASQTASKTATFSTFSLLFSAPLDSPTGSKIYQLTHPELGKLDLFITAVGQPQEFIYLEAVCSQQV